MVRQESWSAEAVPASVPQLRGAVHEFAESAGVPDPPLADVRLAVSEALTNAVVHGNPDHSDTGTIEVEATLQADVLRVVVRDTGAGYSPRIDSPGAGLGVPIILSLADTVEIKSADPGTELHMSFAVAL